MYLSTWKIINTDANVLINNHQINLVRRILQLVKNPLVKNTSPIPLNVSWGGVFFTISPGTTILKLLSSVTLVKVLWTHKGSPIPFLITESRKIIWPFHASWEIQNKISHSRKSQNPNSREHNVDLYQESRIT